jgi:hypothetical protein
MAQSQGQSFPRFTLSEVVMLSQTPAFTPNPQHAAQTNPAGNAQQSSSGLANGPDRLAILKPGSSVMKFVIRTLAMGRCFALKRQFKEIQKVSAELTAHQRKELLGLVMRELNNAALATVPHLYGSENVDRYAPWGNGTDIAIKRIRDENAQMKVRGISLWLAVVYHEIRGLGGDFAGLEKQVMASLRDLKDAANTPDRVLRTARAV